MASIRPKPKSKYWYACFTLPGGKRVQKSTKTTDRELAQKLADDFERVARAQLTDRQARRIINDIHEEVTGSSLNLVTVKEYLIGWLKDKDGTIAKATQKDYEVAVTSLLDFLGQKGDLELVYLKPSDIVDFRKSQAAILKPGTVNKKLRILGLAFRQAWKDGLIDQNPVAKVSTLRDNSPPVRRPFTLAELEKLLSVCGDEWKGLVFFGVYTAQRLGDIASVRWDMIDADLSILSLTTQKTGRRQVIPLAAPLRRWLIQWRQEIDDGESMVFPSAYTSMVRADHVSILSWQFYSLLVKAGLAPKRTRKKKKAGEKKQSTRRSSPLTFHSLRHTATSLMKNAGVSPAIVQEFVGHDSPAVSQIYTHIETAALVKAANALPDLTSV